jgi:hypothetical protein
MTLINTKQSQQGLEPFAIADDAYEAIAESEV